MKKSDKWILIICLAAAAVLFLIFQIISGREEGTVAAIYKNGELYGTYSLSEDRVVTIEGKEGSRNVVEMKEQKVSMLEASCPDKICVKQHGIRRNKESITCLPNKVVVEIQSKEEAEFDSIAK